MRQTPPTVGCCEFAGIRLTTRGSNWLDETHVALTAAGAPRVALLGTEPAPNDYPALPVRTVEHVVVRVSVFDGPAAHTDHVQRARRCVTALAALRSVLAEPWHELRLEPTNHSPVR